MQHILNISSLLNDCGQWLAFIGAGILFVRAERRVKALEKRMRVDIPPLAQPSSSATFTAMQGCTPFTQYTTGDFR